MRLIILLISLFSCFFLALGGDCSSLGSSLVPFAKLPEGFCAYFFATGLKAPRGIFTVENGDVLVVEQALAQVTVLYDQNGDGFSSSLERSKLAGADGLNHGVTVHEGYLYASSSTKVYRWKYSVGDRHDLGKGEVVVKNIPCCHHVTRSIIFDAEGRLYVQVGSGSNVDRDSTHSRIARFRLPSSIPAGGVDWALGEVFADGLRNEVGLRFDRRGKLWGVENGVDNLFRADLGGDIHKNNPSEELNFFDEAGRFYGYPYCWSVGELPHFKPGTQFVHPNFQNTPPYSDAWCQNTSNVVPPIYNFKAHQAPLDLFFWSGKSFPISYKDGLFVAFHGSWNRNPPSGYRVDFLPFDEKTGMPSGNSFPFLQYNATETTGNNWPHRPVGLTSRSCPQGSCLLVSSDASGVIIAMSYLP